MQSVSDGFLRALRGSHVIVSRAIVFPPDAGTYFELPILSGSVSIDRSQQVRRQASLVVPWTETSAPQDVDPHMLAFGGYVLLERGLRFVSGETELVPLGMLRIDSVSWRTSEHAASLSCSDRMSQVKDEPLLAPFVPDGMSHSAATQQLVAEVFAGAIAYHIDAGTHESLLAGTTYTDDRANAVSDLASAVSCEAFFDEAGDFVYRPRSTDAPVWTVDAGPAGVLIDAAEALDRQGTYNGVLATGQPDADMPPISALVVDSDPNSPTRWGGPFGRVAMLTDSTAIQTVEQAQATARGLLNLNLGLQRTLDITSVPNPALQAGDVITVAMPDGTVETQQIDALSIPLGPTDPQTLTARSNFEPSDYLSASITRRTWTGAEAWREVHEPVPL